MDFSLSARYPTMQSSIGWIDGWVGDSTIAAWEPFYALFYQMFDILKAFFAFLSKVLKVPQTWHPHEQTQLISAL